MYNRPMFRPSLWICAVLVAGVASSSIAMGRRSRYVSTADDEIRPAQRGSAANPNSAYAPPRFDDYVPPSSVEVKPKPSKTPAKPAANGSSSSSDAWSSPAPTPARQDASSSAGDLDLPAPAPAAKSTTGITPQDSSEPPALDITPESPGVSGEAHPVPH